MNTALIFAGGTGTRMNSKTKPKQFLKLNGKPIIIHTIENFEKHPEIDNIVVVCISSWVDYLKDLLIKYHITKVKWVVNGGETGQDSRFNGLKAVYEGCKDPLNTVVLPQGLVNVAVKSLQSALLTFIVKVIFDKLVNDPDPITIVVLTDCGSLPSSATTVLLLPVRTPAVPDELATDRIAVSPWHIVGLFTLRTGNGVTVTVTVDVI